MAWLRVEGGMNVCSLGSEVGAICGKELSENLRGRLNIDWWFVTVMGF